jgi:excisionase family DNA binding protein
MEGARTEALRISLCACPFLFLGERTMDKEMNLIPAKAAALELNISRATLSRLVKSRRLGAYRIGHKLMFDRKILEQFKAASYEPPQDGAGAPTA